MLAEYDWSGNVWELEHAIGRTVALSSGPVLHIGDLPTQLQDFRMHLATERRENSTSAEAAQAIPSGAERIISIAEMEKQAILGDDSAVEWRQAQGGEAAWYREDDALSEAEGVWDLGCGSRAGVNSSCRRAG